MIFHADCPSCGASTPFQSAASILAVCTYCQSTVYKDAQFAAEMGKIGQVLEDYSPLQIASQGIFEGVAFNVIGRLQLRYAAGLWNEWFIIFDDGRTAWLAESAGQYVLTQAESAALTFPAFDTIQIDHSFSYQGVDYVATDVRTADCVGGEGELPFRVGQGYVARLADYREAENFLTLDYSDADTPILYRGKAVEFAALRGQNLRSEEAIYRSAGKYRGVSATLACPNCGGGIQYQVAVATQLNCPSCAALIDASGDIARVLAKQKKLSAHISTLALGAKATIAEQQWVIIGLLEREELDAEGFQWAEYLLYHKSLGFLWLVESEGKWYRSAVLNSLPLVQRDKRVVYRQEMFNPDSVYQAKVIYAAGAFNWRVQVGDVVQVCEFIGNAKQSLSKEVSINEATWSLSSEVPASTVNTWFGTHLSESTAAAPQLRATFSVATILLWGVSLLFCDVNIFVLLLASAAFYLPLKFPQLLGKK